MRDNTLSKLLIVSGTLLVLVSLSVIWRRNDPDRLSFEIEQSDTEQRTQEEGDVTPKVLRIGELGISLPVVGARLNKNRWETTSEGVSYLIGSPLPGEKGNAVFYGHNWGSILGNLTKAKPGQRISVYFDTGKKADFEISLVQEVTPDTTSILDQTEDTRLTIYTCSGLFDQKRFVVIAFPVAS